MTTFLISVCVATVLLAIPLCLLDYPVMLGEVCSSGAMERWSVKILLPLALLFGLALSFHYNDPIRTGLSSVLLSTESAAVLAVALSALLATMISGMISRYTSLVYAFVGAIFGCRLMIEGSFNWSLASGTLLSWIAAPLVCALLAAGFAALSSCRTFCKSNLVRSDASMLKLSMIAAILFAGAFAWNNGPLLSIFPSETAEFPEVPFLSVVAGLLVLFFFLRSSIRTEEWRIADMELDIPVSSVFSVMAASALTMALFSTPWVSLVHLSPAPLSVSALMVVSLFSVSLVSRRPAMEGETMVKSVAATVAAPVLGLLISYCICVILNVRPDSPELGHSGGRLMPMLILLGIIAAATSLALYVRAQRSRELRKQILDSRERQVYAARKSLAAIETKAEMNEKDLLNKLEIKRKELVDFAMGISDQKAFMEDVYGELKTVRQMAGEQERDAAIDNLLKSIRERMYFSSEMNDFYAQTEILHKDFNMRLGEAFPNLTESERKLANLLRQGFSSKYIASLMNITPKSVEISRYRLRAKLGLKRSDNLIQFIKTI
ncbi:MAG: hypothetical protein J5699_07365 [Bacteroidales bacterium]|nr:hypothetical protein [Bacteroidales bacterium]